MRILIIEDELKVAEFIRKGLQQEGYAVDVAYDGQEGAYQAETFDYDAAPRSHASAASRVGCPPQDSRTQAELTGADLDGSWLGGG